MSEEVEKKESKVQRITYNTLDNLLSGVYSAVINAQATVSQANMDIWREQHFLPDGTPKTIRVELPGGPKDVPTLILVPQSNINIKDVTFEMEMGLDISEEIEEDLDNYRPVTYPEVKEIALGNGWFRAGNQRNIDNDDTSAWGFADGSHETTEISGLQGPKGYRLLYQYGASASNSKIREGKISLWRPSEKPGDWDGRTWISDTTEKDFRKSKVFRMWLDLEGVHPSIFGIASYINTSTIGADSSARGAGDMAKIVVTFEGSDVPEGVARLNDLFVKMLPTT